MSSVPTHRRRRRRRRRRPRRKGLFFSVLGAGSGIPLSPATIQSRELAGSITSSMP